MFPTMFCSCKRRLLVQWNSLPPALWCYIADVELCAVHNSVIPPILYIFWTAHRPKSSEWLIASNQIQNKSIKQSWQKCHKKHSTKRKKKQHKKRPVWNAVAQLLKHKQWCEGQFMENINHGLYGLSSGMLESDLGSWWSIQSICHWHGTTWASKALLPCIAPYAVCFEKEPILMITFWTYFSVCNHLFHHLLHKLNGLGVVIWPLRQVCGKTAFQILWSLKWLGPVGGSNPRPPMNQPWPSVHHPRRGARLRGLTSRLWMRDIRT